MTNYSCRVSVRSALKIIAITLLCGGSTVVYAQTDQTADNASSPTAGVDIIVTATRKSEPLSKVPASITAISSDTIKDLNIKGMADYARLVPNLAWGNGTGGAVSTVGSRTVIIRGIAGNNTTNFYIDDTPLPQSLDPRIYFLDRIEVLRGPQGTLFGSSSMGGTIRMITSPPTGETINGSVEAELFGIKEGGAVGTEIKGGVNIPLAPGQVSAQMSGIYSYTPGYFKRTYNDPLALNLTGAPVAGPATTVDNMGAVRTEGGTVTLQITPTALPGLTLTPMAMYSHAKSDGTLLADYSPDNLVQRRIVNVPEGYDDKSFFGALSAKYDTGAGRIVSSTSWFDRKYYNLEDGTDGVLSAYRASYVSFPYVIFPVQGRNTTHEKQFTQELRFESDFSDVVQLVAGGFYQKYWRDYRNDIQSPGLAAATGGRYSDNNYTANRHIVTKNLSVFGSVSIKPVEQLELTAGLRYSDLKYDEEAWATGNYGYPGIRTFHASARPVTPRFSIKYEISPSVMIYSTVAQGFRMGGANNTLGAACAGLGLPYPTDVPIQYKSDKLWSYEAGIKTSFNNRILFSATAYRIDWSQRQQAVAIRQGLCYTRITVNTGSAVSQGLEFETTLKLTSEFSLRGGLGYTDAKVTDPGANTSIVKDQVLDSVPKWTGSINADYVHDLGWGEYFLRGGYSYTGASTSFTQTTTGLRREAYNLADVRTGLTIGAFTATVYAENLFDERPNLSEVNPGASIVVPRYRYFVGQPRTIGVEFGYKF